MVTILTIIFSSPAQLVQYSNGPVIRCPVPAKIDHLNTGLVGYSDFRYILTFTINLFNIISTLKTISTTITTYFTVLNMPSFKTSHDSNLRNVLNQSSLNLAPICSRGQNKRNSVGSLGDNI